MQSSGKKNDKDALIFTYPVPVKQPEFLLRPNPRRPPDTTVAGLTTIMNRNNKTLDRAIKYIVVKNVKDIDTLSVFNEQGINGACRFDMQKTLTLEFRVPLKYLGLSADKGQNFSYHIVLKGRQPIYGTTFGPPMNRDGTPVTGAALDQFSANINKLDAKMVATTDFWGEYTLAKK